MDRSEFKYKYSYPLFLCHDSFVKGLITISEKNLIKRNNSICYH